MSDIHRIYERVHSLSIKDYKDIDAVRDDLDELVEYIEENFEVETLGSHERGDDGVWRKVK